MRTIKFRAWDKKNKRMEFASLFNLNLAWTCKEPQVFGSEIENFSEIMQYTGLKDKNGKEIYEGDVCNCLFGNENEFQVTKKIIIEWKDLGFVFRKIDPSKRTKNLDCYWTNPNCIEVIGNVWENKELLEVNRGK